MSDTDDLAPQFLAQTQDRLTQEAYDTDFGDAPAAPATAPQEGPSETENRGQVSKNLTDAQLKMRKSRGTDFIDAPDFAESWTMQAVGGLIDGVNAMTDLSKMGSDWLDENVVDLSVGDVEPGAEGNPLRMETIPKADHTGKSIVRGIAQFLAGWGAAGKALKFLKPATKIGAVGKATAQGFVADFAAFDGQEERLSNFLMEHTELRNPVLEYLAADPGDSELEGRLKNGLEGALIGVGVDVATPVVKGFVDSVAMMRKARLTRKAAQAAGRLNPDGSVSLDNSGIERDMGDAMADLDGVSQEGRKRPLFRPASDRLQSQVIDRLDEVRLTKLQKALAEVQALYKTHASDLDRANGDIDRSMARVLDKHFEELPEDTQQFLMGRQAVDFESGERHMIGVPSDVQGGGDFNVHGAHIFDLREEIEQLTIDLSEKGRESFQPRLDAMPVSLETPRTIPDFLQGVNLNALNYTNGLQDIADRAGVPAGMGISRDTVIAGIKAKFPDAFARPEQASRFVNTRGKGERFHGSAVELGAFDEGHYRSKNYYGNGFYTTDAVDVAVGYGGKAEGASIYKVTPKGDLNLYNMEARIPASIMSAMKADSNDALQEILDENPQNLRAVFDGLREISASGRISADEVQEIFQGIQDELAAAGFRGMTHKGGVQSGAKEHEVAIYFNPKEDVTFEKVDPEAFVGPPPPAKALNINLARIQGPDDIKAIIDEVAKRTPRATNNASRGTIPLAETEDMAQKLGMTVDEVLERQKGTAFNAEQAVASRNILAASATMLQELAVRAAKPEAGQLDKYRFRMALGMHRAIQHQVAGMTAEAGRALSSFRIEAVAGEERLKAIRQYVNQNGDDIDGMAAAISNLTDPAQVGLAVRQMDKRSAARRGLDAYLEVWVNGILSGPPTQAVNLLSNAMFTTWQIPERALAARLRGQGVQKGEAYELAYGAVAGFKDSIIAMGKVGWNPDLLTNSKFDFARKESINAESFGMDPRSVAGAAVDLVGKGVRIPGRFLQAGDAFFKTLNYRMELRAQAFRAGTSEGLEGEALAKRMAEFMADPPDEMMQAAINFADTNTFTKRAREGSAASYLTRKINEDAPLARLILPFVQTPANLMSETFQRTPLLNMAMQTTRDDLAAGGARRQLAQAKVAAGSMLAAAVADMTSNGLITGQGPADPEGKASWRRNGVQPNSIRIGDKYYAYNRLDPLGFMIGMTADIADASGTMTTKDVEAAAMMAGLGWAQNITSKTYLQGVSDLLSALQSQNGAEFQRYIARQGASMSLPYSSLFRTIRRETDPMMRDTAPSGEGMGALGKVWQQYQNEFINMLPQYSKDLPPYMNLWGEPIYYQGGLGPDIASPVYQSKNTNSAIDREIFRLNFDPQKPQKQITHNGISVELNPHEHAFYIKTAGQMALPILERYVRNPAYSSLTDPQRITAISSVLDRTREAARAQTLAEFPELRSIFARKAKLLMESGRPQVPDMPPRSPFVPE